MEAAYESPFGNGSNFLDYLHPDDVIIYRSLPFAVIHLLLSLIGLAGNVFVMYIFLRYDKIRSVSNIYIFNLAISDAVQMLNLFFLAVQETTNYWPFVSFWCKVVLAVEFLTPTACTSFVTVMSIDRSVVLYRPLLASRWRKPKVACLLSIAVWVISILSTLPVTFFQPIPEYNPICAFNWFHLFNFTFFHFYLGFLQPVTLIAMCLCMTAVKAPPAVPSVIVKKHKGSDRTRMVVVLFVVYMILWLPKYIFMLLSMQPVIPSGYSTRLHVLSDVGSFVNVLTSVKCCIYPFIYWHLSSDFRQYFQSVLCCRKEGAIVQSLEGEPSQME
ncbi:somatostatin receptor type 5-like [Lissotriton helveticus]